MILCVSKINVNKAWIQAKIHAEPASQKSFANQWCRMPTWHGEWRHREISYRSIPLPFHGWHIVGGSLAVRCSCVVDDPIHKACCVELAVVGFWCCRTVGSEAGSGQWSHHWCGITHTLFGILSWRAFSGAWRVLRRNMAVWCALCSWLIL